MIRKLSLISVFCISFLSASAHPPEGVVLPLETNAETLLADLTFKKAKKMQKFGHHEESVQYFREAAEEYKAFEQWGKFVRAMSEIGSNFIHLKKFDEAQSILDTAESIALEELYTNHASTASVYFSRGEYYKEKRQFDESILSFKKALKIWRNKKGEKSLYVGSCYSNLGIIYTYLGKFPTALEYLLKELIICLEIIGPDDLSTAHAYHNIGTVYWYMGDYPQSAENLQKALSIKLRKLGPNNIDVASSYHNLGNIYGIQGDDSMALDFYEKALKIRLLKLGENLS